MEKPYQCQNCPRYFDSQKGLSMHTYYKHRGDLLKASPPTTTLPPGDTTYWSKKRRPNSLYGPIVEDIKVDSIKEIKKPRNDLEMRKWQMALKEYDEEMKNKCIQLNGPKSKVGKNKVKRLKTTKAELEDKMKSVVRLSYKLVPSYDLLDVFEVKKLITEICSVNSPGFELTSEEQLLVEAMVTCSNLLDISIIIRARSGALTTLLKKCYMS